MRTYADFASALRRAENLKRQGIWPGITGPDQSGWYTLTWDPDGGDE